MIKGCVGKGSGDVANAAVLRRGYVAGIFRCGRRHRPVMTRRTIRRNASMIKCGAGKCRGIVANAAVRCRRHVSDRQADSADVRKTSIVTRCAIPDDPRVIKIRRREYGCRMTNIAVLFRWNMIQRRILRHRKPTVVAATAAARNGLVNRRQKLS